MDVCAAHTQHPLHVIQIGCVQRTGHSTNLVRFPSQSLTVPGYGPVIKGTVYSTTPSNCSLVRPIHFSSLSQLTKEFLVLVPSLALYCLGPGGSGEDSGLTLSAILAPSLFLFLVHHWGSYNQCTVAAHFVVRSAGPRLFQLPNRLNSGPLLPILIAMQLHRHSSAYKAPPCYGESHAGSTADSITPALVEVKA